jgi:AraC-like DNA-binding protein
MDPKLKYERREYIAKRLVHLIDDGVSIPVIMDTLSAEFGTEFPSSSATLYKIYGQDIAKARAAFQQWLGGKARQRIEEGSDKILELALRSKAGWKPESSVDINEGDGEGEGSALDTLMELMGKKKKEEE